ncbi:ParB-like nuclease domain protein [compost metagenome]
MARRPGGRNMDKVKGIAEAIQSGEKMDPIVLVKQSDGSYQIADGYHRTLGFQKAGKDKIKAYVATNVGDDGPWDEEMHEKKLNVEPGKTASRLR